MGVRGLTTFIAQHASRYLDPHELHDCNLVIDGDNLCSQLYKQSDRGLSAFGGNYDEYFRTVVEFFGMLKKCNVTPYVLLDGGYEMRKMKTTRERLRARIGVIKYIIPVGGIFVTFHANFCRFDVKKFLISRKFSISAGKLLGAATADARSVCQCCQELQREGLSMLLRG